MKSLLVFACSFICAGGAVYLLARRDQARLEQQGALLEASLRRQGGGIESWLIAQGNQAQASVQAMAASVGRPVAEGQARTTLAGYGITPQLLSQVSRLAARVG